MEFKIVEDSNVSKDTLEHFENHDFGHEIAEGLKDKTAFVSDSGWENAIREIKARKQKQATKMSSFRLPLWLIDALKEKAQKGGVKYSEYVIQLLLKGV